jgi:hypothetical protein
MRSDTVAPAAMPDTEGMPAAGRPPGGTADQQGTMHAGGRSAFAFVPAQGFVARFPATFREFPPRRTPASFSLDQVIARLRAASP